MRSNSIDENLPIEPGDAFEIDPAALNSLDHDDLDFDEGEALILEWGWY